MIMTVTLNAAIDKRYVVDHFNMGKVNRVIDCSYTAGGKGLNVSRAARIAGEEVIATGFVGGHSGDYIIEQIEMQGIKDEFIKVDGESRSCINIYDMSNHTQTEILEPGFYVDQNSIDKLLVRYSELMQYCNVVTISGSLPKGCNEQIYQKMIQLAKDSGKKVILDTSGKLLSEIIKSKPTMIKPNLDEIKDITGSNIKNYEELIIAAKALYQTGIEIVVISLGEKGSLIVCNDGVYKVTVPKVEAVNVVGCGDTMVAGFAMGLSRNMPLIETIKLASAISVSNSLHITTGYYRNEDVEKILPLVQVELIQG